MKKISISEFNSKPYSLFHLDWALLTAGPLDNHNSMTISWGEMGTLWNKNVVTVYVKPCRYTYNFMENNEYFVLSFFDKKYRQSLQVMGNLSGRDVNKDQSAHLNAYDYEGLTLYKEASVIIICKKIYFQDLSLDNIPKDAIKAHYEVEKPHRMYIGEVIEILSNE